MMSFIQAHFDGFFLGSLQAQCLRYFRDVNIGAPTSADHGPYVLQFYSGPLCTSNWKQHQ